MGRDFAMLSPRECCRENASADHEALADPSSSALIFAIVLALRQCGGDFLVWVLCHAREITPQVAGTTHSIYHACCRRSSFQRQRNEFRSTPLPLTNDN
jgi:hypothetical protein